MGIDSRGLRLAMLVACLLAPVGLARAQAPGGAEARNLLLRPVREVPRSEKRALVIGISRYPSPHELRYPVNDAKDFARFLQEQWGFDGNAITLMTDEQIGSRLEPTWANIDTEIERLLQDARPNSEIVFYFSGHGVRMDNQDWLVPRDGVPDNLDNLRNLQRRCHSITTLRDRLEEKRVRRAILFVDACRFNVAARTIGQDRWGEQRPRQELAILYGCQAGQLSREAKNNEFYNGVFTHFLLQGLRGAEECVDERSGDITFDSLTRYVTGRVQEYVRTAWGDEQTPFGLASFGEMVLVKAAAPKKPVLAEDDERLLMAEAYTCQYNGDDITAAVKAQQILSKNPKNANAHHVLGWVYFKQGKLDQAIAALNEAVRLQPGLQAAKELLREAEKRKQLGDPAVLADEAVTLVLARRFAEARTRANDVLAIERASNADRAKARFVLGRCNEEEGRKGAAYADYQEALLLDPECRYAREAIDRLKQMEMDVDIPVLVNEGLRLLDEGRFAEAEERAARVIALSPRNATAHYVLGRVYASRNRLKEAIEEYDRALAADPLYRAARQAREDAREALQAPDLLKLAAEAQQRLEAGDAAAAAARAKEVLDRKARHDGANALAHFVLGALAEREGKAHEALVHYQLALWHDPSLTEARAAREKALARLNAADPKGAPESVAEAERLLANGDLPGAAARLAQALALDPRLPRAHYLLGRVHAAQGRPEEALQAYRLALALDPKLADAARAIAELEASRSEQQAQQLVQQAQEHFRRLQWLDAAMKARKALELAPRDPKLEARAHATLGTALVWLNGRDQADGEIDKALQLDSSLALAHVGRGLLLFFRGDYPGAEKAFREAAGADPKDYLALNNLGAAFFNQKRYREAADAWSRALQLNPEFAIAHLNLGHAYFAMKEYERAEKSYREAVRLDAANPGYRAALASALFGMNRVEEARREAQAALKNGYRETDHFIFEVLKRAASRSRN